MDMLTVVAILMVGTVIASVFLKKVPMQFTLCIIPVVCGLILGYPIKEIGDIAMSQIMKSMQSAGIMCLFAMIYFTMLSETGMFNTITRQLIKLTRGRVSVYMVMILTSLVAGIGMMTATVVTAYTIVFPAMMPLYKKMKFDRAAAMIIAQTAIAGMCFLPWGIAVVNSSVFASVDAMELSRRLIPVAFCFIPAIVLQWVYFGIQHKRQGLPMMVEWSEENETEEENPLRRPKLFWINLVIFLAVMAALVTAAVPSYLVFIIASFLTIMIDYREPKDYQKMLNKAAGRFGGTMMMLIGISVFLGIFNETGMVNALAAAVVGAFPAVLTRYIHLFLAAIMVLVIRFMPNKIYNSMYPALISMGSSYGLAGVDVIAPFVCNMSLATGISPFTATTHVGVSLLELDIEEYCRKGVPVMEVTNLMIIVIALCVGVIR